MKTAGLITVALLAVAVPAWAQGGPPGGRGDGPRGDGRGFGRGGGEGGFGRMSVEMAAHQLKQELELTDAQHELFEELVDKYQAQARERRQFSPETRALMDEYRNARSEGDEERARELRAQLREERGRRGSVVQDFFTELETILEPQQVEALHAYRERMRQEMERRTDARELLRNLPDELNLSEEQRAEYRELLRSNWRQMREQAGDWRAQREELQAELREAEQSGDDARVAELQETLMRARPPAPDLTPLFDALEPLLDAEQKAKLATLRSEMGPAGEPTEDLDKIARAVRRLKLDGAQRDQIKEIMRAANRAERAGPHTPDARHERAAAVKTELLEVLTADQKAQFERLLSQDERGRRPRGEGRGEGRGGDRRGAGRGGQGRGGDAF